MEWFKAKWSEWKDSQKFWWALNELFFCTDCFLGTENAFIKRCALKLHNMNAMQLCKIQLPSLDLKYPEMLCFMALKVTHFLGLLLLRFGLCKCFKKKAVWKIHNWHSRELIILSNASFENPFKLFILLIQQESHLQVKRIARKWCFKALKKRTVL